VLNNFLLYHRVSEKYLLYYFVYSYNINKLESAKQILLNVTDSTFLLNIINETNILNELDLRIYIKDLCSKYFGGQI